MSVSRRRRTSRTAVAAGVAVALCTALGAATARGATVPDLSDGLFLTVSGAGDTWVHGVRLTCPDTRGAHPHGAAACDELAGAHGDLNALRGEPHGCTREYDPVTVAASGTWHGTPVDWRREFGNACTMDAATGSVFRF